MSNIEAGSASPGGSHFPAVHFGLETEIGVQIGNGEERDLVADSIAVVQSAREPGVWMRWDYAEEDPHLDMRGFRVRELRQDTDESGYATQDSERGLSYVEVKSDLVLGNGARFYNDHAHPEYLHSGMSISGGHCVAGPSRGANSDGLRPRIGGQGGSPRSALQE